MLVKYLFIAIGVLAAGNILCLPWFILFLMLKDPVYPVVICFTALFCIIELAALIDWYMGTSWMLFQ